MAHIKNDRVIMNFNQMSSILRKRQILQKRIMFLQRSLIQMSFGLDERRPELYTRLLSSLDKAQLSLFELK